jgi:drug/metabolite transporter (DMT)-like permease
MMIAPCFLGEKLSTRDVIFTLIIVVGTVICISFGSKEEGVYSIEYLMDLYTHTPFVVFGIFLAIIMAALYFLMNQSSQREKKFLHTAWDTKFQAVAYPAVAGTVAALSVLFAKSSTEIIKETVKGQNQFTHVFSYFLIVMTLLCLYLQVCNCSIASTNSLFQETHVSFFPFSDALVERRAFKSRCSVHHSCLSSMPTFELSH